MRPNSPKFDQQREVTVKAASDIARAAQERTDLALRRAQRIRDNLQKTGIRRPDVWEAGRKAMALFQLAADESARSVHEKDRFLAVVSHELRQPLGAAQTALEVLDVSKSDAQAARARAVLRRQLTQMARLVDDLLEMSRYALQSTELSKTTLDLRHIVQNALETAAASIAPAALTLDATLPPVPQWVDGDEGRLLQVFTNLLSNAVRCTPKGGRITVTVQPDDHLIVVEVADTGRGIDGADLQQVFEPFARGRDNGREGFGIGLALVRGVVERHGGSVAVVSDGRDRGSRFTVVLPSCDPPAGR